MKTVKQFRYYGISNTSSRQLLSNVTNEALVDGSAFEEWTPILQLGVQALPGTLFYLNEGNSPLIIGSTGIYELDLNESFDIISLRFDQSSIDIIDSNATGYLIVDIIYDNEGEST